MLFFIPLLSSVFLLHTGPSLLAQNMSGFPKPRGYVTDLAGLLTPQSADDLEKLITFIKEKTTAEVAVVTIDSIEPYTIEDYAVRLFED